MIFRFYLFLGFTLGNSYELCSYMLPKFSLKPRYLEAYGWLIRVVWLEKLIKFCGLKEFPLEFGLRYLCEDSYEFGLAEVGRFFGRSAVEIICLGIT